MKDAGKGSPSRCGCISAANYWRFAFIGVTCFAAFLTYGYLQLGPARINAALEKTFFGNNAGLSVITRDYNEFSPSLVDSTTSDVTLLGNRSTDNSVLLENQTTSSASFLGNQTESDAVFLKNQMASNATFRTIHFGPRRIIQVRRLQGNLRTAFYVEHSPTTGRIYIERMRRDVFLSGRLVGPCIVGLRFFAISAEDFANATSFPRIYNPDDEAPEAVDFAPFLTASYILPYPGKYRLSIKSALVKRSTLFHAVGNLEWHEQQEIINITPANQLSSLVPASFTKDTIKELGVGAPVVFYNSSAQLARTIHWGNFRGLKSKAVARSLQIPYGFVDGRKVDRQCFADTLDNAKTRKAYNTSESKSTEEDDRKICFFGDSHTRYVYNEIVFALEGTDYLQSADIKRPSNSELLEYREAHYPEDLENIVNDTVRISSTCKKVFMNIGQWPLSWAVPFQKRPPYTLSAYEDQLRKVFSSLKTNDKTTEIVWMGMEPCPTEGMYSFDSRYSPDYRHASFSELWSNRGVALAKSFGFRTLENYWYLQPIMELTADTCHYVRPVNEALVDAVIEMAFADRAPDCIEYPS